MTDPRTPTQPPAAPHPPCPKCGAPLPASASRLGQCPACGVFFAKLGQSAPPRQAQPRPSAPPEPVWHETIEGDAGFCWADWLWPAEAPSATQRSGWTVLLAVMVLWGLWFVTRDIVQGDIMKSVLHLPNLAFHEAGHVLLRPFGDFMTILGGSLLQCVMPLIAAVALLRRHDPAGASAAVWWCGQNLLDVAPYIADARSLSLPLIGEASEEIVEARALRHDWHNILLQLDWLEYDLVLARLAWCAGTVIMLAACVWLGMIVWRAWQDGARPF